MARLVAAEHDHDFAVLSTGRPARRVTDEGEYAALVEQEGTADGRPALRILGYVLGDDFYARLSATVFAVEQGPRFRQVVEALLLADVHQLGVRRRRFLYRAPAGWDGRNLDTFHAAWFPPDHPRDASRLTVFPAMPLPGGTTLAGIEALAREPTRDFVAETQIGPRRQKRGAVTTSRYEVTGQSDGHPTVRDVALLQDERWVYPLVIDSPPALAGRNRALLDETLATVELLPRPPGGGGEVQQAIDHWM